MKGKAVLTGGVKVKVKVNELGRGAACGCCVSKPSTSSEDDLNWVWEHRLLRISCSLLLFSGASTSTALRAIARCSRVSMMRRIIAASGLIFIDELVLGVFKRL